MRPLLLTIGCIALLGLGCEAIQKGIDTAVEKYGDEEMKKAYSDVKEGAEKVIKAAESFTLEQEYYIGRSVAAQIMSRYGVYEDESARRYIGQVGNALASCSAAPETFSGYHFLILDSDEINAFAAPGAFIFVTRGMLQICSSEDELAAVLAHEIAHIEHGHAIATIKGARRTRFMLLMATEAAKRSGEEDLVELTGAFGEVLNEIVASLIEKGYDRSQERDSDHSAVAILRSAGYDATALVRVLENMDTKLESSGLGFAKTHPPVSARIETVKPLVGNEQDIPAERTARFTAALSRARAGGG